eukprot:TRINITY_DN3926_c0_g1_i2.p1 TRINITY_DN3926_c0_g1~~TRINITY_DN3926_c0_g1_i2.p1  ORF type:complete len:321 (-),score=33.50 TRINITY_DN3926_c0_g1_i2:179-1141(-)
MSALNDLDNLLAELEHTDPPNKNGENKRNSKNLPSSKTNRSSKEWDELDAIVDKYQNSISVSEKDPKGSQGSSTIHSNIHNIPVSPTVSEKRRSGHSYITAPYFRTSVMHEQDQQPKLVGQTPGKTSEGTSVRSPKVDSQGAKNSPTTTPNRKDELPKSQPDPKTPTENERTFVSPSVNGMACARCNQPVVGEHTIALGKVWHSNHFTCETCGTELLGDFFDHDGKLNCRNCAEQTFHCDKCNKLLDSEYFVVKGQRFHSHCLSLSVCTKCKQNISTTEMVALGKHYHPECFLCSDCGRRLPAQFYNREGQPVCEDCCQK